MSHFNYLGVVIDTDLSFKDHCKRVNLMSFSRFIQLCNIKKSIEDAVALEIYKTRFYPFSIIVTTLLTAVRLLLLENYKLYKTNA